MVQETHMHSSALRTPNYSWRLGPQSGNRVRASRGCGFLISNKLQYECTMHPHSADLVELKVKIRQCQKRLVLLCVHVPVDGFGIYSKLSSLLRLYLDR